jgi:hypothetical protein
MKTDVISETNGVIIARVPAGLKEFIKRQAKKEGRSVSKHVAKILKEHRDNNKGDEQ